MKRKVWEYDKYILKNNFQEDFLIDALAKFYNFYVILNAIYKKFYKYLILNKLFKF